MICIVCKACTRKSNNSSSYCFITLDQRLLYHTAVAPILSYIAAAQNITCTAVFSSMTAMIPVQHRVLIFVSGI